MFKLSKNILKFNIYRSSLSMISLRVVPFVWCGSELYSVCMSFSKSVCGCVSSFKVGVSFNMSVCRVSVCVLG